MVEEEPLLDFLIREENSSEAWIAVKGSTQGD
jgi:hypothetical protein